MPCADPTCIFMNCYYSRYGQCYCNTNGTWTCVKPTPPAPKPPAPKPPKPHHKPSHGGGHHGGKPYKPHKGW